MPRILLSLLLLLSINRVSAQFSLPYEFGTNTDFSKLTAGYDLKTLDELEVLDERVIEYAYDKEGNLFEYLYIHEIRYVNSEDAIDRSNKIYISGSRVTDLEAYDVRVVLANGKVNTMGKDALKEGVNEDKQKVSYMAVSGAEKGSYIEYYYLVKREAAISGSIQSFQARAAKARVVFKIISPENLYFKAQSFNGFPNLKEDTTLVERNMLVADTTKIIGIYDENFANEEGNKMRVIYQLYYNTAKGKRNPYNYGIVSQNIFDNICNTITKEESKQIDKLLKSANIKYAPDDESKVRAIENYIKRNFNFTDNNDDRLMNIETMVRIGALSENGSVKLFYHMFQKAGLEMELVVTSNRFKIPFDKEFESYAYLTDFVIYFPKLNKYMAPFAQTCRLGLIPHGYTDNYGLFIRKVSVGELNTGAGKVKYIPANPAKETQHNMFVTATFAGGNDSLNIDFKQEFTGYYAEDFQPYFDYLNEEKTEEFQNSIVKTLNENVHISSVKVENKGGEFLMLKPLILNSKLTASHFIEKAGPKILVKVGELIGPQSELYQEKTRLFPVENDYNRTYHREIVLMVPEGYQIKNAADLNLVVQPFKADGDGAGFVASYKLEGNKLTIICDEYYNQIKFPLSSYENYRAVINAAANFNKIVLVLEKK